MSLRSNNFYDRFSFFYPLIDLFLKPQKKRLCREVNAMPPGTLLDIGVGNGSHFKYYNTHIITGIDSSAGMLAIASKQSNKNITLLHMDGEELSFRDESFDYIVLSHVIAVAENPEKLLGEVCRVVKPKGTIFILNHFTPGNPLKYIDKIFRPLSRFFHFRSVFYKAGLKSLKNLELIREINFRPCGYFKLLIYRKP